MTVVKPSIRNNKLEKDTTTTIPTATPTTTHTYFKVYLPKYNFYVKRLKKPPLRVRYIAI